MLYELVKNKVVRRTNAPSQYKTDRKKKEKDYTSVKVAFLTISKEEGRKSRRFGM